MAPRKPLSIANRHEVTIPIADAADVSPVLNRVLHPDRHLNAHSPTALSRSELLLRAEAVFRERERRLRFFKPAMFGEPAWDIILAIYILDGRDLSASRILRMVHVPQSTGLRWMQYLEKERFVTRSDDDLDRRAIRVRLSERGREILDAYFASIPQLAEHRFG